MNHFDSIDIKLWRYYHKINVAKYRDLESFAERGGSLSTELLLANKIYQQDSTPIKYLMLYRLDDLCASQPLHDFMESRNILV